MPELIPREGADAVAKDLKFEIDNLSEKISNSEVVGVALEQLQKNKDFLQKKLNEVLLKRNVLTDKEYDDAYESLRLARREILMVDLKKTSTRLYIFGGLITILLAFYIYKKNKK